jgi:hypothetical protein
MSQWNELRLLLIGLAIFIGCVAVASQVNGPATLPPRPPFRNQIVVSPDGPSDGGDFGPHTPGTQTSGLQEALDAAIVLDYSSMKANRVIRPDAGASTIRGTTKADR